MILLITSPSMVANKAVPGNRMRIEQNPLQY